MKITAELLKIGTGCTDAVTANWVGYIQSACDKFTINKANRVAAFLANVGVESGGLASVTENLNYSAQGLANTWPNRYAVNPKPKPTVDDKGLPIPGRFVPNDLALKLQHNPEAIANNVYANRLGNGDEASGDGWKYRGQGLIQVTGKSNIIACGKAIGIDLSSDPSLLQKPAAASLSAAWFFNTSGCNELADTDSMSLTVDKINGRMPCIANNGALRIARYSAVKLYFRTHPE